MSDAIDRCVAETTPTESELSLPNVGVDLEDCDVVEDVPADDDCLDAVTIAKADEDAVRRLRFRTTLIRARGRHDVRTREDVALARDDEAGALSRVLGRRTILEVGVDRYDPAASGLVDRRGVERIAGKRLGRRLDLALDGERPTRAADEDGLGAALEQPRLIRRKDGDEPADGSRDERDEDERGRTHRRSHCSHGIRACPPVCT